MDKIRVPVQVLRLILAGPETDGFCGGKMWTEDGSTLYWHWADGRTGRVLDLSYSPLEEQ